MSQFIYITPFNPLQYGGEPLPKIVDERDFIPAIKLIWPEIKIWPTPQYGGVAAWELNYSLADHDPTKDAMQGSVDQDGQLGLNYRIKKTTLAKFSVWYRNFVPPEYRLFLWFDWNVKPVELLEGTTEQEILEISWRD